MKIVLGKFSLNGLLDQILDQSQLTNIKGGDDIVIGDVIVMYTDEG